MPLVKTTSLAGRKAAGSVQAPVKARTGPRARTARGGGASERIGAAALELASGIGEAASAAAELQQAMDQIARGADEAAGAAQESSGLIVTLVRSFADAREQADLCRKQADQLQTGFVETNTQIESSVAAIELNAERQLSSVSIVAALEERAGSIGAMSRDVSDISDQTSLLALNAALEAARAGEHGRGFSIVADEVRALAETSETNASEVQALTGDVVARIRLIAERLRNASAEATREGQSGRDVAGRLAGARRELADLADGAQAVLLASVEAEAAGREAERGAEQVASAAEEQAAAAAEARQAISQQTISLDQSHQTAEELSAIAERLQADASDGLAEQISAAAEELSATVQELSGAAAQILVSVEQINRGADLQAAATTQADAAIGQIEAAATLAQTRGRQATDRIDALQALISSGKETVERLVAGVETALKETQSVNVEVAGLGEVARRIEKIVDGLALVAVQISMLAVSGSVEATRAGDSGVGFATVAIDIRKLSRSAAENAEGAKDIVGVMQDQIGDLRRDLDQIASAAEVEVSRNRAVMTRLDMMIEDLAITRRASGMILSGADAILAAAREIRTGTERISTAAEEASAASRQASTAAQQQSQGAEQLAAAIEDIASLANSLIAPKA